MPSERHDFARKIRSIFCFIKTFLLNGVLSSSSPDVLNVLGCSRGVVRGGASPLLRPLDTHKFRDGWERSRKYFQRKPLDFASSAPNSGVM